MFTSHIHIVEFGDVIISGEEQRPVQAKGRFKGISKYEIYKCLTSSLFSAALSPTATELLQQILNYGCIFYYIKTETWTGPKWFNVPNST